jgi:hypothetical protein
MGSLLKYYQIHGHDKQAKPFRQGFAGMFFIPVGGKRPTSWVLVETGGKGDRNDKNRAFTAGGGWILSRFS